MTKLDWFMLVMALLLVGACVVIVMEAASPVKSVELIPECDYDIPMWKVRTTNKMGIYEDDYIRMTVEEANGVCR